MARLHVGTAEAAWHASRCERRAAHVSAAKKRQKGGRFSANDVCVKKCQATVVRQKMAPKPSAKKWPRFCGGCQRRCMGPAAEAIFNVFLSVKLGAGIGYASIQNTFADALTSAAAIFAPRSIPWDSIQPSGSPVMRGFGTWVLGRARDCKRGTPNFPAYALVILHHTSADVH